MKRTNLVSSATQRATNACRASLLVEMRYQKHELDVAQARRRLQRKKAKSKPERTISSNSNSNFRHNFRSRRSTPCRKFISYNGPRPLHSWGIKPRYISLPSDGDARRNEITIQRCAAADLSYHAELAVGIERRRRDEIEELINAQQNELRRHCGDHRSVETDVGDAFASADASFIFHGISPSGELLDPQQWQQHIQNIDPRAIAEIDGRRIGFVGWASE